MARREIPVGNADDVMRIAQRQRCPGGMYYVSSRYDTSNPFSDALVGDVYAAFKALRISNRDQRIFLAYVNNESLGRIAEHFGLPKSTVQEIKDTTEARIIAWGPFGQYVAIYEAFGCDIRALFELFS